MGATKLQNLFKTKSPTEPGVQEKARLEQLIKRLQEKLQDPEQAKKAARIIEQFLHSK